MTAAQAAVTDNALLAVAKAPRCGTQDMLKLLQKYDCWVFDLDGTLWRGDALIQGAIDALLLLKSLGKNVLYMTNNSMKSRQSYLGKFQRLGVPAQLDEIYCSSYSAAAYLDSINFNSSKKAYVVGEHGIMDELAAVGISSFGGPDDNDKRCSFSQEIQQDPQPPMWMPGATSLLIRSGPGQEPLLVLSRLLWNGSPLLQASPQRS
eukprot:GHRR01033163.1.p1 GENE.GHRR01033163.1~~GHRR01033163.1.p1  ORF type:complete len:206 (+),score=65.48 GHRR01033163.1:710-1327(+)